MYTQGLYVAHRKTSNRPKSRYGSPIFGRASSPREMRGFICLLTDLNIEPDVIKMLQSLIRQLPHKTTGVLTLNDILQSINPTPVRFLSSLEGADRLLERHQPELKILKSAQLRKFLFIYLKSNKNQLNITKLFLI